jgi:signal transduction histidine kinase
MGDAIVAVSADGIAVIDDQETIRFANEAAREMLGRGAGELAGTRLGFAVTPGAASDVVITAPDGTERVLDVRAAALPFGGEQLLVVALRDVTQRAQAERELSATLERQNFALAVAAHELHSPLAAISVLTNVLADPQAAASPAERADIADRVVRLTGRLQLLVDRLLMSARIDADDVRLDPEPVLITDVIAEQLTALAHHPVEIEVVSGPPVAAAVDRAALSMMLANYLDNALTHASPPIAVDVAEREGWAEIRVTDHGPGVPEPFVPDLFERFTRAPATEHTAEGTGLGLWIVRSFAQANGGDAWYEAADEGGSTFFLRLPLAR